MNKLAVFLAVIVPLSALAAKSPDWKCEQGQLRVQGKAESSSYCVRSAPREQLLSKNCYSGKCELIERIRKAPGKVFRAELSPYGNPDFHLCRKLGGTPRKIAFQASDKWKTLSECRFSKDQSFANLDFLYYMAKRVNPALQD